jgi:hypothetical protein
LERASLYEPEAGGGPVFTFRHLSVGAQAHGVLTRCCDAGLDHTSRRNYLAHHLVFAPGEMLSAPGPADYALHWGGWRDSWSGGPQWFDDSVGAGGMLPPQTTRLPATAWERLGTDAGNAALPCPEGRALETLFDLTGTPAAEDPVEVLRLFAESALLSDTGPWTVTFSTRARPDDRAAGILWRAAAGPPAGREATFARNVVRFAALGRATASTPIVQLARTGALPEPPGRPAAGFPPAPMAGAPVIHPAPPALLPPGRAKFPDVPGADGSPGKPRLRDLSGEPGRSEAPDGAPPAADPDIHPDTPEEMAAAARRRKLRLAMSVSAVATLGILGFAAVALLSWKDDSPRHDAGISAPAPAANARTSDIQKAYETEVLVRELAEARRKREWKDAAALWGRLEKADAGRASEVRAENLPAIRENLPAFAAGRLAQLLDELSAIPAPPGKIQRTRAEIASILQLLDAVGARQSPDIARHFQDAATRLDFLEALPAPPPARAIHAWDGAISLCSGRGAGWRQFLRAHKKFRLQYATFPGHAEASGNLVKWRDANAKLDVEGGQKNADFLVQARFGVRLAPRLRFRITGRDEVSLTRVTTAPAGDATPLDEALAARANVLLSLVADKPAASAGKGTEPARVVLALYSPDSPPRPFALPRAVLGVVTPARGAERVAIPEWLHRALSHFRPGDARPVLLPASELPFARFHGAAPNSKAPPSCDLAAILRGRRSAREELAGKRGEARQRLNQARTPDAEYALATATDEARRAAEILAARDKAAVASLDAEIAAIDRLPAPLNGSVSSIPGPWVLLHLSPAGHAVPIARFE